MKAIWNDVVIAESEHTVVVEANHYFPMSALHPAYFKDSQHTTHCSWKGLANYFTVIVNGKENLNAAWIYKKPLTAAANIKNHVAFWKGVTVTN